MDKRESYSLICHGHLAGLNDSAMRNTAKVIGGKPIAVYLKCKCHQSFDRRLRHLWKKERGAILLFRPGHHTRQ
jgi:hypothetical protein